MAHVEKNDIDNNVQVGPGNITALKTLRVNAAGDAIEGYTPTPPVSDAAITTVIGATTGSHAAAGSFAWADNSVALAGGGTGIFGVPSSSGANSLASGSGSEVHATNSTALNGGITNDGADGSTAIGNGASTLAPNAVAIGDSSTAIGQNSAAFNGSSAEGDSSFTAGAGTAQSSNSIGLTGSVDSNSPNAVAVAGGSVTNGLNSFASGINSSANAENTTALSGGVVNAKDSTAVSRAEVNSELSFATNLGITESGADYSVSFGGKASRYNEVVGATDTNTGQQQYSSVMVRASANGVLELGSSGVQVISVPNDITISFNLSIVGKNGGNTEAVMSNDFKGVAVNSGGVLTILEQSTPTAYGSAGFKSGFVLNASAVGGDLQINVASNQNGAWLGKLELVQVAF